MQYGGPKNLPVLQRSADYIVSFFEVNELIFDDFVSPEEVQGGVNRVVFTTAIH